MNTNLNIIKNQFSNLIFKWYKVNKRDLPWRIKNQKEVDPYKIWVSEIMLQQTTVKAVIPYYKNFLEKWPNICDLANSPKFEILEFWSGLGYYSRANNLYNCAKIICSDFGGKFPSNESQLIQLPGIGLYTSAAISAIAFGKRALVIDTNIRRIISRVFLVKEKLKNQDKKIRESLDLVTPYSKCYEFPQALMDIGSEICKHKSPKCEICPLSKICISFKYSQVNEISNLKRKIKKPIRKGKAFIIIYKNQVLMEKRKTNGLLPGMSFIPTSDWDGTNNNNHFFNENIKNLKSYEIVNHEFSHFKLQMQIYIIKVIDHKPFFNSKKEYFWLDKEKLNNLKMTTLLKKIFIKIKLI